jgi:hypothetical protein
MVSSIYNDSRKSYYTILKNKLLQDNGMFTVFLTTTQSCYSGKDAHRTRNDNFKKWATQEAEWLESQIMAGASIISVDESIFNNFPQERPANCTPELTNWTHPEYWDKKQSDYLVIKAFINKKLEPLRVEYEKELLIEEQNKITEDIRLAKELKQKELDELARLENIEYQKQLTEQEREDDRIIRILNSLGIQNTPTQQEETKLPFGINTNSALMVGGIGLMLLLGLKK